MIRPIDVYELPAAQQPRWWDRSAGRQVRDLLSTAAGLVTECEVERLRLELAAAARGEAFVLQAGDCAESFRDGPEAAVAKAEALTALADQLTRATGRRVVRVARIAGQYGKPRSSPVDAAGTIHLPAFRGHIVNGEEPTLYARQHDPTRMVQAYRHAAQTMAALRADRWVGDEVAEPVWTSHEALVLDYEIPLTRPLGDSGKWLLTSTHLPWIGARTNQPESAHVALCARIANPVGCKITADTKPATLLELCDRLNPGRQPGRLVFISRMGARAADRALPPLLRAAAAAGHPATWLCDPMHGNTYATANKIKTRHLDDIVAEVDGFLRAHERAGTVAGGVHLELAAQEVTECLGFPGPEDEAHLGTAYLSLCDPRLSPAQAAAFVRRVSW